MSHYPMGRGVGRVGARTTPSGRGERLGGWALALDRAPVFLSVLLVFVTPFFARMDGVDPHLPKLLLFRLVVSGLLAAFLLQCLRQRRWILVRSPIWLPWALLLVFLGVSAILSPYRDLAVRALPDALLPFLWFALLTVTVRELWRMENLLISYLAGALGVSAFLLAWRMGLVEGTAFAETARMVEGLPIGRSGGATSLTGTLLVAWPLALALLMKAGGVFARVWWGLTLAVVLSALLLTVDPAGWVGLVVGAVVFATVSLKAVPGATRKVRFAPWGVLFLILVGTALSPLGSRLGDALRADDPGRVQRTRMWENAQAMNRDRVLIGFGAGTFGVVYPSYRSEAVALDPPPLAFDESHAHNLVLEWGVETGLVGLALVLGFWIAVILPWWRLTEINAIPRPLGAAAFAVFSGVFACSLLGPAHAFVTTLVPLFLVAAMPVALAQRFHAVEGSPIRVVTKEAGKGTLLLLLLSLGAGAWFLHAFFGAFKAQSADLLLARAVKATEARDWAQAFDLYPQVLQAGKGDLRASYFLGSATLARGATGDAALALAEFEKVGRVAPDLGLLHLKRSMAARALDNLDLAKKEERLALRRDPTLLLSDPRVLEARVLAKQGKWDQALRTLALVEADIPSQSLLRLERATCLIGARRWAEARQELDAFLRVAPRSVDALLNLGYVAEAQGDRAAWGDAIRRLESLIPGDPRLRTLREKTQESGKEPS